MKYTIELKPKAVKDLKSIQLKDRQRIIERMDALEDDLAGNVKKLTNHTPEYRMRSGNWRVLFEIEESLEDYEDLKDLREAKYQAASESTVRLADIRSDLLSD